MTTQTNTPLCIRLRAIATTTGGWQDLAIACAVSVSTVSNWMVGCSEPRMPEMVKLSAHMRVSLDWLCTGKRGSEGVNEAGLDNLIALSVG